MLRYRPPKSSVWGHSLGKMLPSIQRERLASFEDRAVARVARKPATFFVQSAYPGAAEPSDVIAEFEDLFGRPSRAGQFELNDKEYNIAMDALVKSERELPDLPYALALWEGREIKTWRIKGRESETDSSISWVFGTCPRICTTLYFSSRDEFYCIQEILEELRICRLNEKHLREIKRGNRWAN